MVEYMLISEKKMKVVDGEKLFKMGEKKRVKVRVINCSQE